MNIIYLLVVYPIKLPKLEITRSANSEDTGNIGDALHYAYSHIK